MGFSGLPHTTLEKMAPVSGIVLVFPLLAHKFDDEAWWFAFAFWFGGKKEMIWEKFYGSILRVKTTGFFWNRVLVENEKEIKKKNI